MKNIKQIVERDIRRGVWLATPRMVRDIALDAKWLGSLVSDVPIYALSHITHIGNILTLIVDGLE
jgi:hypothetical protein